MFRVAPAGTFVWTGFIGHCREIVTEDLYAALQTAVLKRSPRAMHDVNKLWAPFYCPELAGMTARMEHVRKDTGG